MLTILEKINSVLWGDWLLFTLIGIGILYTIITGGVQIRHFPYIIRKTVLEPLRTKKHSPEEKGSISSFQALCTAIASCVGSGNIVGVSTAILGGGMGALFWMWVAAFFGMATKYGEIILGMLYRQKNDAGEYVGGPFYYIEKGMKAPWLATLCALFMVLQIVSGNFIQSNTIAEVLFSGFRIPRIVTGIFLVVLIFIVSTGGLKRLSQTAEKIVPLMAFLYVAGGLVIVLVNITKVPSVFSEIFQGAFSLQAIGGGISGVVMKEAMRKGVARGLYSNEAGEGSGPVLHAAANVAHPALQGIAGVTEVFIDTLVIATISGLAIGVTGVAGQGIAANMLVAQAFSSVWAPLGHIVTVSLLLFCTTTVMSQWYFGFVGLNYVFGFKVADKFKYIFPFFCIIGALLKNNIVWELQDIALALLTIPNLAAMLVLFPKVRAATKDFFSGGESSLKNRL